VPTKNSTKSKKSIPPGLTFELIVARLQQMLDPSSSVTHNEKIVDRVGIERQYDVVIRGHFGGRSMLGVIECKDHSRKKSPDAIEAFAKKCENVGANLRIIVSKNGFTEKALRLAKHENIGCLSLLQNDSDHIGFSVGDMWYGILRRWTDISLMIHFDLPTSPITNFDANTVKWEGKPVGNWFMKQLLTKFIDRTEPGKFEFTAKFDTVRYIEIESREWPVSAITCSATQVHQKKRTWVKWSGDAFLDWHTKQLTVPPLGTISASFVSTDLSTWPDYDGEIPDPDIPMDGGVIRATLMTRQAWIPELDAETPSLENL
jgi:Restriction endonuclease